MRKLSAQEQALSDIVRSVVESTSRSELILVDALVRGTEKRQGDDMLGWGLPGDIPLLAPVLLEFLRSQVFMDFWKDAGKGVVSTLAEHIGVKLTKHFTEEHGFKLDLAKAQLLRDEFAARLETSGFDGQQATARSEEHTSELQSRPHIVC